MKKLLFIILFTLPVFAFCENPILMIENKIIECQYLIKCQGPESFESQYYSNYYFYLKGQLDAYQKCLDILAN